MDKLKPCPFCGGEATIKYQEVYMSKAVFVHCKVCKARVMEYFEGTVYFGSQSKYMPMEEATKKAIEAWNRRATSV